MVRETVGQSREEIGVVSHLNKTKKVQKLILAVNICITGERTLWPVDFKRSEDHLNLEMNASSYLSLVPLYI